MGAFDNLLNGVAGVENRTGQPATRGGTGQPLDELPAEVRKHLFVAEEQASTGGKVQKQEVDRRATLPSELMDKMEDEGAQPKPYDPEFLRDLASSSIPQTYIDTLSQDAKSASWRLKPRDEESDVDEKDLAKAERKLEDLIPDMTFSDFLENLSRTILQLGDGVAVKHFPGGSSSNPVAECVHVDSATMFKKLDEDGYTDGYIQFHGESLQETTEFELDEVVWFSWAGRSNHVYGQSPVDKGDQTIEILEEINEKEILDLVQGMQPGVISVPEDMEYPVDSTDFQNFKDDMRLTEGERHRLAYTEFPINYTQLSSNYQEMQLLDRYITKVTELGGVFKVNPSYAGFDFQNSNRATDESQREAYKQRGFQVLIDSLESGFNQGLVPWLEFDELELNGEDLRFEFERETTVGERVDHARMVKENVEAAKTAAQNGLTARIRDEKVVVEDGEITADDVESEDEGAGGGMGGLLKSDGMRKVAKSGNLSEEDVRLAYEKAESSYDPQEAENPVVVYNAMGGVGHSAEAGLQAWESFYDGLLEKGASAVLDLYSNMGAAPHRAVPEEYPTNHDSAAAVFGISKDEVESVLDGHPDVYLSVEESDIKSLYKSMEGGSGNSKRRDVSKEQVDQLDEWAFRAFREQIFPESIDDIEKRSWAGDRDVPEYVLEKIREAIDDGAVFDKIESAGEGINAVQEQLEEILEDRLTQSQGWSLESITDDISSSFPTLSDDEAETIARSESASVLNKSREKGYEDRPDSAQMVFGWVGPDDSRTTEACELLKEWTNPEFGGNPVPMNDLKKLQEKAQKEDPDLRDLELRDHNLHPNERHTFRRFLPHEIPNDGLGGTSAAV